MLITCGTFPLVCHQFCHVHYLLHEKKESDEHDIAAAMWQDNIRVFFLLETPITVILCNKTRQNTEPP